MTLIFAQNYFGYVLNHFVNSHKFSSKYIDIADILWYTVVTVTNPYANNIMR